MRHIRELMSVWEAWQRFGQPAAFEPPQWDEADVFNNVLPWTAASAASGLTEQHLRFRIYCVAQELQRCNEELTFLPQDALNVLSYFEWQQQQLAAALAATGGTQLAGVAAQMAAGKSHMLKAWQARIAVLQQQAVAAFVGAGWLVTAP